MFRKNSFVNGLLLGLVFPVIGFGILYFLFGVLESTGIMSSKGFSPHFKERTIGIVAIAFNAILMNIFQKKRFTDSMRGVVLPTFIYVAIWMYLFLGDLI
ncbi:MAG: hypothetical protein KDC34_04845 [Saprospiraceae bacterium]|nr:hypothetical protein [Saprospiraceae bacterium]